MFQVLAGSPAQQNTRSSLQDPDMQSTEKKLHLSPQNIVEPRQPYTCLQAQPKKTLNHSGEKDWGPNHILAFLIVWRHCNLLGREWIVPCTFGSLPICPLDVVSAYHIRPARAFTLLMPRGTQPSQGEKWSAQWRAAAQWNTHTLPIFFTYRVTLEPLSFAKWKTLPGFP